MMTFNEVKELRKLHLNQQQIQNLVILFVCVKDCKTCRQRNQQRWTSCARTNNCKAPVCDWAACRRWDMGGVCSPDLDTPFPSPWACQSKQGGHIVRLASATFGPDLEQDKSLPFTRRSKLIYREMRRWCVALSWLGYRLNAWSEHHWNEAPTAPVSPCPNWLIRTWQLRSQHL